MVPQVARQWPPVGPLLRQRGTSVASIAEALFENLAHVVAQSEVDGERFRTLGAQTGHSVRQPQGRYGRPAGKQCATWLPLQGMIGPRKTWAAISTHQGEEDVVAQVHHMLKARHRDSADDHRARVIPIVRRR